MDFSSGGKRLSGFLKWWLLAEWIIREVVIRKVEMIRRAVLAKVSFFGQCSDQ